jgi:hypothetical protein
MPEKAKSEKSISSKTKWSAEVNKKATQGI